MAKDIAYHREAGMAARIIVEFARTERQHELQKLEDLLAARGSTRDSIQSAYAEYESAYTAWRKHLREFAAELERRLDRETWPDDALRSRIEELVRRSHADDDLLQAIRKSREYFRAHFGAEPSTSAQGDTELDEFVRAG